MIDCTEIYIERPLNLQARAQTWYNYKNTNTIKYLIAITPVGAVSFLSRESRGRFYDKEVTMHSGSLQHGDLILADRGFDITEILLPMVRFRKALIALKGDHRCQGKKLIILKRFRMLQSMLKESLAESVKSKFYNQLYQFCKCIFLIMLCQ